MFRKTPSKNITECPPLPPPDIKIMPCGFNLVKIYCMYRRVLKVCALGGAKGCSVVCV